MDARSRHDQYAILAERFERHYDSVRGAVRSVIVSRQLDVHLPPTPAQIADVGGGTGRQVIRLAQLGYDVALIEPSAEMLSRARVAVDAEPDDVRARITFCQRTAQEAPGLLGQAAFDAVLCHAVVLYVDDPAPIVAALAELVVDGGMVSFIAKNRDALAMRPALEGRYADALVAFDADRDVGGVGVPTRADRLADLEALFDRSGLDMVTWYGVRVFSDQFGDAPPGPDIDALLEAEWLAGSRDPYRALGRLLHLIASRRRR